MTLVILRENARVKPRGILRVREIPYETEEEFLQHWSQMSNRQRKRYEVAEFENTITTAGLASISAFLGNTSTVPGFALYLGLGVNPITIITVGDGALAGESFRKVPTLTTLLGNTTDIDTYLASGEGNNTYTDAGLWSGAATGTLGTGTLNTHVFFPYTKLNNHPVTLSYLIVRN